MNNKGSGGKHQVEHACQHPLISEEKQTVSGAPQHGKRRKLGRFKPQLRKSLDKKIIIFFLICQSQVNLNTFLQYGKQKNG